MRGSLSGDEVIQTNILLQMVFVLDNLDHGLCSVELTSVIDGGGLPHGYIHAQLGQVRYRISPADIGVMRMSEYWNRTLTRIMRRQLWIRPSELALHAESGTLITYPLWSSRPQPLDNPEQIPAKCSSSSVGVTPGSVARTPQAGSIAGLETSCNLLTSSDHGAREGPILDGEGSCTTRARVFCIAI